MPLRDFTKDKFDIIIQAGQSNSDGRGLGFVDHPYTVNKLVWYLTPDYIIEPARETVQKNRILTNYSLAFAQKYLESGRLEEGRKLLILRTAVGGTGFLDNHWKLTDDLYLRMIEMIRTALALNPENHLVALLWHQGETDACHDASYDVHYEHLMTLVTSVRNMFHVPALPFVAGDFVQQWIAANEVICEPVVRAIRSVCRDAGHAAFVETDGLYSNAQDETNPRFGSDDTVHFCRSSLYELGYRYFDAFANL